MEEARSGSNGGANGGDGGSGNGSGDGRGNGSGNGGDGGANGGDGGANGSADGGGNGGDGGGGNGGDGGGDGGNGSADGGDGGGGNGGDGGGGNGGDGGGANGGDGGGNGGDGSGSPGPGRAELFSAVVDAFLQKLVAAGSYQRFSSCYRDFSRLQPELSRSIHSQFVSQLQASIREEIQEVMEEGNLKVVLNSLDKIVEEEKSQEEPAWRPSGVPEEDARSSLVPPLLKQRSHLLRALRHKQEENRRVAASVLKGRGRIRELQQRIQEHRRGWEALNKEQQELVLSLREPQ